MEEKEQSFQNELKLTNVMTQVIEENSQEVQEVTQEMGQVNYQEVIKDSQENSSQQENGAEEVDFRDNLVQAIQGADNEEPRINYINYEQLQLDEKALNEGESGGQAEIRDQPQELADEAQNAQQPEIISNMMLQIQEMKQNSQIHSDLHLQQLGQLNQQQEAKYGSQQRESPSFSQQHFQSNTQEEQSNQQYADDPQHMDDLQHMDDPQHADSQDHLNQEKYFTYKDINANFSNLGSKRSSQGQPKPGYQSHYEVLYQQAQDKRKRILESDREKQLSQDPEEDKNCTFKPQIYYNEYYMHKCTESIYERNQNWLQKKQQKIEQQQSGLQGRELDGCTFKPDISSQSKLIVSGKVRQGTQAADVPQTSQKFSKEIKGLNSFIERQKSAQMNKEYYQKLQQQSNISQNKKSLVWKNNQVILTQNSTNTQIPRCTIPEKFQFKHQIQVNCLDKPYTVLSKSPASQKKDVSTMPFDMNQASERKDQQRIYELKNYSSVNKNQLNSQKFDKIIQLLHEELNS